MLPKIFSLLYSNEVQTVKTDSYIPVLFDLMAEFRIFIDVWQQ